MKLSTLLLALWMSPGGLAFSASIGTGVFFEQHCYDCHDAQTRKGGLDLTTLKLEFTDPQNFAMWVKIHDRIEKGDMPPAKVKKRPLAADVTRVTAWLDSTLLAADQQRRNREGRSILHRLTRQEYENTVRDLFSLPALDLKDMLPEDGQRGGYDKLGEALDLSEVQLSKYLDAADYVLDTAIATRPEPPPVVKRRLYPSSGSNFVKVIGAGNGVLLKNFRPDPMYPAPGRLLGQDYLDSFDTVMKAGVGESKSAMALFQPQDGYLQTSFGFSAVYAGRYRLKYSAWSLYWNAGAVEPAPKMEVAQLRAEARTLGYFEGPSLEPKVHELSPWLNVGDQIYLDPATLYLHDKDVRLRPGGAAEYSGPALATDWLEVEGPLFDQWPPPSHRVVFGNLLIKPFDPSSGTRAPHRQELRQWIRGDWPDLSDLPAAEAHPALCTVVASQPLSDAARLLGDFLPRAFRAPVDAATVQKYVNLVKERLGLQDGFEDAMRYAVKAALTSSNFLFHREASGKLDDVALASRLAYWLWDTAPDEDLFALATQGKLHQPAVLNAQVERLLNDPKSDRFIADFLDQWLKLRDIDSTDPDSTLYPEFHTYLKDSMLAESRAFLRELIKENLSATNVVASDFVMINERLADHYRFIGPKGPRIQKVQLPSNSERGGFLTQGSILKITANGTTTSPVVRGVWVNERILGTPVPPPPGGVPAIDPDTHGATTIREQLEKHRADPICAACHAKMDPPGFALECFDVIGGYRNRYRSIGAGDPTSKVFSDGWRPSYKFALPVECSGQLADGRSFKDLNDLRRQLLADPEQIARNLTRHLLTYATSAEISYADRPAVEQILAEAKKHDYGVRSLIHAIAESPLFQEK